MVIPTYNRAWGVIPAVESVLCQADTSLEVIVADDAGTDETAELLARIRDPRLVVHRQPRNLGIAANWGAGLHLARGEFIAFLMDDDRHGPGFLSRRVEALDACPRAAVVFSPRREFSPATEPPTLLPLAHRPYTEIPARGLMRAVLDRSWFIGTALYRRSPLLACWEAAAGDDLVIDFGVNLELARRGHVGIRLEGPDFLMAVHQGQNSRCREAEVFAQTEAVLDRHLRGPAPAGWRADLRRELSDWRVLRARRMVSDAGLPFARRLLWHAARTDPANPWAWKQLAACLLTPRRWTRESSG